MMTRTTQASHLCCGDVIVTQNYLGYVKERTVTWVGSDDFGNVHYSTDVDGETIWTIPKSWTFKIRAES